MTTKRLRYLMLLPLAILLASCSAGANGAKKTPEKKREATHSSLVKKKTASKKDAASASSSKKVATSEQARWNPDKDAALSAFMKNWQAGMHQTYDGTYDGKDPDHYGFRFPAALTSGRIRINGELTDAVWSRTGVGEAPWQVVAVASGTRDGHLDGRITYLFTLHEGEPVVLVTLATNGGELPFEQTKNQELIDGFKNIVNRN